MNKYIVTTNDKDKPDLQNKCYAGLACTKATSTTNTTMTFFFISSKDSNDDLKKKNER